MLLRPIAEVVEMAELTAWLSADIKGLIIASMWGGRFPPSLTDSASCHILIRCLMIGFSCSTAALLHTVTRYPHHLLSLHWSTVRFTCIHLWIAFQGAVMQLIAYVKMLENLQTNFILLSFNFFFKWNQLLLAKWLRKVSFAIPTTTYFITDN